MRAMPSLLRTLVVVGAVVLAGCASPPRSVPPSTSSAERAAASALKLVGAPYRYGGASPRRGFDCSGLVQYSYRRAGVSLPHNTELQRRVSKPIRRADLRRGDLVFFDEQGKKSSHVGIYVGHGLFVHAPSSGKRVREDRLDSPYWRKHLSETRRVAA